MLLNSGNLCRNCVNKDIQDRGRLKMFNTIKQSYIILICVLSLRS